MTSALDDPPACAPSTRQADPCAMVIFGASGDLTRRKLMPALVNLLRHGLVPGTLVIVAVARTDVTEETFRRTLLAGVAGHVAPPLQPAEREWFEARIRSSAASRLNRIP